MPPSLAGSAGPAGRTVLDRDRALLWHPYGSLEAGARYSVHGAEGPFVDLVAPGAERPQRVLDGMSSWWSVVHGYRNPVLDAALRAQIDRFSHVMFGGLTHAPAVELAERLVEVTPQGLDHVFLADSGSVSVEVALKLAVQYQRARGGERGRFLALRGAYHGDTTGAMSVCDPVGGMHADFASLLAPQVFAPQPPAPSGDAAVDDAACAAWEAEVSELLDRHGAELAGIIVEPVFQGAGAMRAYLPRALRFLREAADRLDAVFITDEIATGFGRTGTAFACEQAGIVPDVMCVGKALTGGYLTLAALLCSGPVAEVISRSSYAALMHGPTFMANPLACAVAAASVDLLFGRVGGAEVAAPEGAAPSSAWYEAVPRLEAGLRAGLAPAASLEGVAEVAVTGGIGVVRTRGPVDVDVCTRIAAEHGVWLRPFRDAIYTMPPYLSTEEGLARITAAMVAAAAAHEPVEEDA
ncbi:adenosylmethionine-8-amino-7-oxononanoate aminotransferase [Rothia kristinae]|uniref:adenosylmethionine--8-amino-7-oxononanoate transaminase n=1 Tax=Rothia kristinae TaxID=37923 RepID=UPI000736DC3F|nr:adenosylmethionine--8-amino-7-oxononanoate transaminase [Rothia kristinae]KTR73143.1 adenosylmethionine-8-amino-7-oxononanoate aminotransferase [Rothia kristinae]KTR74426.1 adenosylmethionine-8-amino-7-oxononanoate aminotransferase [Rothia kristinae]KTR80375.1 adenosylmethionine-8-amino-7-oxononanoate aminotransferase [Rothia kristinae]KTR81754.1 adenosylmethionine-8-amino-7-oxononanoate aminotransferase [Rothia kristinae]KTR92911.1 adenosylmethionine-8-amino-7-oxononanoate aminotransferase